MADVSKRESPDDVEKLAEAKKQKQAEVAATGPQSKMPLLAQDDLSNLWLLLFNTPVAGIRTREGKVYYAQRTGNLGQTFQELVKHNFTSCPVITAKGKGTLFNGKQRCTYTSLGYKYFNFLDLSDIVRFVANHFKGSEHSFSNAENFWALIRQQESFATLTVDAVTSMPN